MQYLYTVFLRILDIPEREPDDLEEMDATESSECCEFLEDNSTSQKKDEPLKKEKRKPKNFNKPLTREVCLVKTLL